MHTGNPGIPSVVPIYYAGSCTACEVIPPTVVPVMPMYYYGNEQQPVVFVDCPGLMEGEIAYPPPHAQPEASISAPPASMSEGISPKRKRKDDECCDECCLIEGAEGTCCERCSGFSSETIVTECGEVCPCCCHACYHCKVIKGRTGSWTCLC
jgi:hypothetical protein